MGKNWKIQGLVKGRWEDDAVGRDNRFKVKDEAEALIPDLARIFGCGQNEFRVVEVV